MHCAHFTFDEIKENSEFSHIYLINDAVYEALSSVFQDQSPIHTDESYAKSAGFSGRVMHGAILQGFLSHFIGMRFPGKSSLILSININYHRPSYLGDELELMARVRQKVETGQVIVLEVKFLNRTSGQIVASGRVQVALRHE
jgi:3-hydroxybutyryl-CoA dehydratase